MGTSLPGRDNDDNKATPPPLFFQRKKDSGKACIKTQDENIREAHYDELKEAPVVCPQLG